MKRILEISYQEPFKIVCSFNNGEQRLLDLQYALNPKQKYTQKILNNKTFKKAKIGVFGEIYWEGIAEMKDLEGNTIPCEYDISPDFAYIKSMALEKEY